jgi:hypothetical protein
MLRKHREYILSDAEVELIRHPKKPKKKKGFYFDGRKRERWTPAAGGKQVMIYALMNKEGYSFDKAEQLVNTFALILWSLLMDGKKIELEGLGTLTIASRKTYNMIEKNLYGPPSIMTKCKKYPKSVELLKPVDLTYKE